jgi:hypothetical protein
VQVAVEQELAQLSHRAQRSGHGPCAR